MPVSPELQLILDLITNRTELAPEFQRRCVATGVQILKAQFGVLRHADGTILAQSGELSDSGERITVPVPVGGGIRARLEFGSENPDPGQTVESLTLLAQVVGCSIYEDELRHRLEYLAHHDPLTGLPNRLLLRQRLEQNLAEAAIAGDKLAVIFIDLDRFKEINDTLGHGVGDDLLHRLGSRLRECLPDRALLARMGGDEFTALVPGLLTQDDVKPVVNGLLECVRQPTHVEGHELFVTASVGVSFYPEDGDDGETLLRASDRAMYMVKYTGKDDVRFFRTAAGSERLHRLEIETQLRHAVERQELRTLFQPQTDLSGRLLGFELLLDWQSPVLGRVSPGEFIAVAEESGLILTIGEWVFREACRRMALWNSAAFSPVFLSVNISALQWEQPGFCEFIKATLRESGAPASRLELEITESAVMRDLAQGATLISELRNAGIRTSIDDFGTGYSSLSYLRRLPVHGLKSDRSFIAEPDAKSQSVLQAIVSLAHALGLVVTAEGVESTDQLEMIRAVGCDRAQGILLGRPSSAAEAETLIRRTVNV